jgi:uncharacterized protein with von Willebrand factor type A (vWA) domain
VAETPTPARASEPDRVVIAFVRALRSADLDVPVGATVAFAEALGVVDATRRDDVYWAGAPHCCVVPRTQGCTTTCSRAASTV